MFSGILVNLSGGGPGAYHASTQSTPTSRAECRAATSATRHQVYRTAGVQCNGRAALAGR
jgi:hypothetical protein